MRHTFSFLLLLCLCTLVGCSPASTRQPILGKITWNGQPLEQGNITFLNDKGPRCGALIVQGKFDVPATQGLEPGTYRVAISSAHGIAPQTPEEKEAGASPRALERIPAKYNSSTELTAEVKSSGPNRFEWDLK